MTYQFDGLTDLSQLGGATSPAVASPAQGPVTASLPTSLVDLGPEHFAGIANLTTKESDDYRKKAEAQLIRANKFQTVSGILNLVGGLASSANQFYQATQGRHGLAIGAPLQQIGSGLQSLVADPAQASYEQNASKAAIASIPNLDPQMRQGLYASVDAGQKEAGFKGLFESLKTDNKDPNVELAMTRGVWPDGRPVTAAERANWLNGKAAGRTNITFGPEVRERYQYFGNRIEQIEKDLADPKRSLLRTPEETLALQTELAARKANLGVPIDGTVPARGFEGGQRQAAPSAPAPNASPSAPVAGETPQDYANRTGQPTKSKGKIYYPQAKVGAR